MILSNWAVWRPCKHGPYCYSLLQSDLDQMRVVSPSVRIGSKKAQKRVSARTKSRPSQHESAAKQAILLSSN